MINGKEIKRNCEVLMGNHPDLIERYVNAICNQDTTEIVEIMILMYKELPEEVFASLYVFIDRTKEKFEEVASKDEELMEKAYRIVDLIDEYEDEE